MLAVTKLHLEPKQVFSKNNLQNAWELVKRNASVGGIDMLDIEDFEKNTSLLLSNIQQKLLEESYLPLPYLQIKIKKEGKAELRTLGLPSICDKIVQNCIKFKIEPILDQIFVSNSYGYRQNKGALKALKYMKHIVNLNEYLFFIKADIHNYFDSINHAIIKEKLEHYFEGEYVIQLIMTFVEMGSMNSNNEWMHRELGIPQGNILSPILANLYLHDLDVQLNALNAGYVRYADDFVLLAKNQKQLKHFSEALLQHLSNKLRLQFNNTPNPTSINNGIPFLGVVYNNDKFELTTEKTNRLIQKLQNAVLSNKRELNVKRINETILGIYAFYGKLLPNEIFSKLDDALDAAFVNFYRYNNRLFTSKAKIIAHLESAELDFYGYADKGVAWRNKIATIARQKKVETPEEKVDKIVEKRKKQFEKLAHRQSDLYISKMGVFVGVSKNHIHIKDAGKIIQRVKCAGLDNITLAGDGIVISTSFINYCMAHNIKIHCINKAEKENYLIWNFNNNDTLLWEKQIDAKKNALEISKTLVIGKMVNQTNLIKYFSKYHKSTIEGLSEIYREYILNIATIKLKVLGLQEIENWQATLLAFEGNAAGYYWKYLGKLTNIQGIFESRERQGAKDIGNMLLNYGYAILYTRIQSALLQAGLHPGISYLHTASKGRPSLVFDFIEPYRAFIVDRAVFVMLNRGEKMNIENKLLDQETKRKLTQNILEQFGKKVLHNKKQIKIEDLLFEQAKEFAAFISGEKKQFKPHTFKW